MNIRKIFVGAIMALCFFSTNASAVPTTSPDIMGHRLLEYAEKLIHEAKEFAEWAREEAADALEATNTVTSKVHEGLQWVQEQEAAMKNWLDSSGLTAAFEQLDAIYDTYNEAKSLYDKIGHTFEEVQSFIDGDIRKLDLLKAYYQLDNFDSIAKTCDKSDFKIPDSKASTKSSGCADKWVNRFVYLSGLQAVKENITKLDKQTRDTLKEIAKSEDKILSFVGGSGMSVGSSSTTVSGGSMKKTADYQAQLTQLQTAIMVEHAKLSVLKQEFDIKEVAAVERENKEIAAMAARKSEYGWKKYTQDTNDLFKK